MKQELEEMLIVALMPCLEPEKINEAKLRITMALDGFSIQKEETELTVYEGDVNELILKRFLMAKIARGLSPRTINYYKNSIRMTLEKIGKPYNDITADDIRLYLAIRVQKDGVSKTCANNERRNLSAFYTWLQKEEILLKNPMSKVEPIKEAKKKKSAFSQMELEQIRYACSTARETAIIEVLISTWARVSEIAQIRIDDIRENKITVHGKGAKDREVYLSAKAQLAIDTYLRERSDDNPYLFPRAKYAGDVVTMTKGKHRMLQKKWYTDKTLVGEGHSDACTIESIVRSIGKSAGVPNTHPHRFRRTGATMALRSGMPLITVSKMLGHENIGTTQIYLDISDRELEQAHEKYVV